MKIRTVGLIGAGHMGGALFRALQGAGWKVWVYNRRFPKARALARKRAVKTLAELLQRADCVILAVKPQSFPALAPKLRGKVGGKIVISVMAAVTLKRIERLTGAKKIVRTMPNLPVQAGEGVTGWTPNRALTRAEKRIIKTLLSASGLAVEVKSEAQLNKFSTVSSCGPAYFFYLTDLMERALISFGLVQTDAAAVARATFLGSAKLLGGSTRSAAEWRQAVTSKKGLTEAALKTLKQKKFDKIFFQALRRAQARTNELAKTI